MIVFTCAYVLQAGKETQIAALLFWWSKNVKRKWFWLVLYIKTQVDYNFMLKLFNIQLKENEKYTCHLMS